MKKFFYFGSGLMCAIILSAVVTYAQTINLDQVDQLIQDNDSVLNPKEIFLSKADRFYSATSTAVLKLPEIDLVKVKENYNNNQEIVLQLQELNQRIIYLTQVIQHK